jgi:hypothetical protein
LANPIASTATALHALFIISFLLESFNAFKSFNVLKALNALNAFNALNALNALT